jgi:hypothetical protein
MRYVSVATIAASLVLLQGCDASEDKQAAKQGPPVIVHTSEITSLGAKDGGGEPAVANANLKSEAAGRKGASAAPRPTVNLRDLIRMLRNEGITVTDLSDQLSTPYRRAFVDSTRAVGASEVALLGVKDSFSFIVAVFNDPKALSALLKSPPDLVRYQNAVLIPTTGMTADWEGVVKIIQRHGGEQIMSRNAEAAALVDQLDHIRRQIDQFKVKEGRYPDFVARHWESMVKKLYLPSSPMNPFSPRLVGDRIEVVNNAGISGDSVSRKKAGWVWNQADQKIYAAGFSDEKLKQMLLGAPGGRHYIAMPEEHVKARAVQLRAVLSNLRSARSRQGKTGNPTLAELISAFSLDKSCPENPMNHSAEIQAGKWDARNPPVSGGAGWNYDDRAGKIWANTNIAEENKL